MKSGESIILLVIGQKITISIELNKSVIMQCGTMK